MNKRKLRRILRESIRQVLLVENPNSDAAVEEGVFFESINFSILKKLPVIFICENNFYSVYSPLKVRQPKNRKLDKLASVIGAKSYKSDGLDEDWPLELNLEAVRRNYPDTQIYSGKSLLSMD